MTRRLLRALGGRLAFGGDYNPPRRATQWHRNPAPALGYRRFWSEEALAAYGEQRDAIRAHAPAAQPVTTNLMLPGCQNLDRAPRWSCPRPAGLAPGGAVVGGAWSQGATTVVLEVIRPGHRPREASPLRICETAAIVVW